MRGARAKTLRGQCRGRLPAEVLTYPTYREVPRSRRTKVLRDGLLRTLKPTDPPPGEKEISFVTWTIALSPGCQRFYTQRWKRHHVRSHA